LIIAALETGSRLGELLSLQWHQVHGNDNVLLLPASKTKTAVARDVPMTTRLKAVLEMRRHGPDGQEHPFDKYVFGNEVGLKGAEHDSHGGLGCQVDCSTATMDAYWSGQWRVRGGAPGRTHTLSRWQDRSCGGRHSYLTGWVTRQSPVGSCRRSQSGHRVRI
jgi:integrase